MSSLAIDPSATTPVGPSITLHEKQRTGRIAIVCWLAVLATVASVAIFGDIEAATVVEWITRHASSPWAGPMTIATYLVAGLLLVPVTLLIITTGIVFGPWPGFAYALLGALTGGAVYYWLGRRIGRDLVYRFVGRRVRMAIKAVATRGLIAVAATRFIPVAPHVVVSLAGGAARISFRDYMLGTILAMTPNVVVMVLLGQQIGAGLQALRWTTVVLAVGLMVIGLGLAWVLQRWVGRGAILHRDAERTDPAQGA